MNEKILIQLVISLLLIEGIFSGSEIAILSSDRVTLKKQSKSRVMGFFYSKGAKIALYLLEHPHVLLATTLFMSCICVTGISGSIALYCIKKFPENAEILTLVITSPLVVLFGEFLPKTLYRRFAKVVSPPAAFAVLTAYFLFYPAIKILTLFTSKLSKWIIPLETVISGRKPNTREELQDLISYGKADSEIRDTEKKMIRRILDFKNADARQALIPLVEVDAVPEECLTKDALQKFQEHRHSRMPIYAERVDNIIGILELKDLLKARDLTKPISSYIVPAHYVYETQALQDVLTDMKRENKDMTIVVDEHGGAVGILTFEDIAEEIVGEIYDEYDSERKPYKTLEPGVWLVHAWMSLEALNETLKLELPAGNYETLGGFLLHQFGRIPKTKDELYFDTPAGNFRFIIQQSTEKRIEQVEIHDVTQKHAKKADSDVE